ncbi:MAG: insulinase family protein [Armatimonadetes bacterium]|nr:insulinase family protein [Armatimonadota bacterium]
MGSASIGFWIGAGSRWETPEEAGISHLLEHMLFKGTARRSARDIAEELDSVGGRLNAFTDKEATCYYAKVLGEHLPVAIDVLSDMLLNSVLNPDELDLEKNVIMEEIKQHEDDEEGLIHDIFAEKLWPDHPLGRSVIGKPETVSAVNPEILRNYLGNWYAPDRIIVAVAGHIDPDDVVDRVANAFGDYTAPSQPIPINPLLPVSGKYLIPRETEQVNLVIGSQAPAHQSEERYALACMDVAFGGGMSSRLFQEIRENRGLAYSIGSYFTLYNEGGQYCVYAGTSMETMEEVVRIVREESQRLCDDGLTEVELRRAKNQIKGSMLMELEGMSNRMSRLGKTELYFGRVVTVEEVVQEIEAVTPEQVQDVARKVLDGPLTLTAIGPFEEGVTKEA